jgi:hypothetical protein
VKRGPLTSVHRFLLGADPALGSGRYRPSEWEVVLPRGLTEELRRLPSLHESMHAALTDSTAFGTALHLYAWLGRFAPARERYLSILDALVDSCRHIQEYFATYASLDILREWVSPADVLADYPEYAEYYELAQRLTVLPGFRLPYHGVKAVCRVCMQSRILDILQAQSLVGFRIADLPDAERPDRRLRELRPILTESFWRELLSRWESAGVDRWPEVLALNCDEERHGEIANGDFANLLHQFDEFLFEELARQLLERSGIQTSVYDGHVEPTRELIREAAVLAPDAAFPLYLDADSPVERREEALRTFADEQFVVRTSALPANGRWLDVSSPTTVEPFASLSGTDAAHYFFVIRSKGQITEQYELADEAREWLDSCQEEYVVAVRTHENGASGVVNVLLGFVGGLSQLELLASFDSESPFLLGSIPMSILRLPDFDRMLDKIPATASLTMLFDLPPLAQFHMWRQGDYVVRYAGITVAEPSPIECAFVFEHSAMPGILFIAPCSEQMLQLLLDFAGEEGAKYGRLSLDESILESNLSTFTLTITHLADEERSFAFRGAPV